MQVFVQKIHYFFLLLSFLLIAFANSSLAGSVVVNGYGGTSFDFPIKSYKESKFDKIIKQKYDFSCGSAALATLLYYHYHYDVNEQVVLESMFAVGDKEKIVKKGFSLLDMKKYLASLGIPSDGYKLSLDKLQKAQIPSVVLVNDNGYLHFVVLKGVYGDEVLLGDPALGLKKVKKDSFEKMWNGIAFVIKNDMKIAQASFNLMSSWNLRGKVDLGEALVSESLANFTSDIAITPNYYSF